MEEKDPKELDPQDGGFGGGDTEKGPAPSLGNGKEDDDEKKPIIGGGNSGLPIRK